MKAFITKYALTAGIQEVDDAEPFADGRAVTYLTNDSPWSRAHAHGKDWHHSRESAVAQAEQMRAKKIAALKKQIARLEGMKFE